MLVGGALEALGTLETGSVDLVVTSPPYLGQRDYLAGDDPAKAAEIGREESPAAYLEALLEVTGAARRVLAPHGSIAVELGDSYTDTGLRGGGAATKAGAGWPLAKSLACTPALFEVALAYGLNPLSGANHDQWIVRNFVTRCTTNPTPGRDADKFRPASTHVTVACTSADRYFDDVAVRRAPTEETVARGARNRDHHYTGHERERCVADGVNAAGAPMLDWAHPDHIVLATQPYPGAHFATFSELFVAPFVESMCPLRVCRICGEPSRRIVMPGIGHVQQLDKTIGRELEPVGARKRLVFGEHTDAVHVTVGWTACEHTEDGLWSPGWSEVHERAATLMNLAQRSRRRSVAERRGDRAAALETYLELADAYRGTLDGRHKGETWRPGIVLDPFCGTGTTLLVATRLGRDAIGIDLDVRNVPLVVERVGMHLESVEVAGPARSTGALELAGGAR